jgi:hypothetical protein
VVIEGYKAGSEDENRAYHVTAVECFVNEVRGRSVTIWGVLLPK